MQAYIPTFASPLTHDAMAPVGTFAAAFHKGALRRLGQAVRNHSAACSLYESAVLPTAEHLPQDPACWLPELGSVLGRMAGRPVEAVAHAMIAMHVIGLPGRWTCSIEESEPFAVQGHVFELRGTIAVECDGQTLAIQSSSGSSLTFDRGPHGWRPSPATDPASVRGPAFFTHPQMRSAYAQGWLDPTAHGVKDPVVEWPPEALPTELKGLPYEAAEAFTKVFEALAEAGPYLDWVQPLFRGIAVSPPVIPGRSYSSSHVRHPGVFSCVFPHGIEQLGEIVVHEMSHQYFLILNAIFPLAEVNHDKLYFSSLKGSARTLDRVLLAYHASANMTLYWQDRIRVAGWTSERARELKVMEEHTLDLTSQLDSSDGLTEAGRALFSVQRSLLVDRPAAA